MIGQRLGHYDVIEKLGEGGMGVVYKAHDAVLNRTVAIKVLPVGKAGDEAKWQRFLQEAQALSALNHPNIVTIYDMVRDGGTDFLVMECIEGRTLEQAISRRGLTVSDTLRYAAQLAAALTAAHEASVIHRDLKPGNIMITDKGVAKILDFGLAKLSVAASIDADEPTRSMRRLTEEGSIVGTIAYMSPEQAEGKPVDARSDIFSFGTVLYEMITGQRAFQGDTKVSTLAAILREEPKPMRAFAADVPAELERIVNRCLRKDPNKRFQHCDDLQIALEELKQESDSGSLIPPPSAREGPRRRKWLIWSAGAIAAGAAIAGWIHWHPTKPAEPAPSALSRLTADSGLTTDPALSPDGKLLAYASDRGNQGDNLDIWLQHVGSGSPVQLTKDAGDESEPAFSPDGGEIAFSSSRGGIYVIPVLGGEPRQLVAHGSRPRFSPDGKWIAYHVAAPGSASGTVLREVWMIPASGGAAKRILPRFADVSYPSWSPDGQYLLLAAARGQRGPSSLRRWWVAPASGGEPVMVEGRPFPSGSGVSGSGAGSWGVDRRQRGVFGADGITIQSLAGEAAFRRLEDRLRSGAAYVRNGLR